MAEWLRGHLFTGFPWNAFGYALTPPPLMMQSASLVGIWGLTLAAFVIFAAPVLFVGGRASPIAAAPASQPRARSPRPAYGFGAIRLAGGADPLVPGV